jgi:hypothetical protein
MIQKNTLFYLAFYPPKPAVYGKHILKTKKAVDPVDVYII